MKKILMPLPSYGFDPTEVAIPWKILSGEHHVVSFATPDGQSASPDVAMLTGKGLGILKPILMAQRNAVDAYEEMASTDAYKSPLKYEDIDGDKFDAIVLSGGHDKRIKPYLESKKIQQTIAGFFYAQKPVGAICHGVVAVARSINSITGKSVIHDYLTTALLKSQELLAYNITRLWLKDYYLTYPGTTVEDEVKSVLSKTQNFVKGPPPLLRDDLNNLDRGFIVLDRHYLSARWPGDAHKFATEFSKMLNVHDFCG